MADLPDDVSLGVALDSATVARRLTAAGCIAAHAEAAEMLACAPDDVTLRAWIERREAGEPLAWLTGVTTFCGHRIGVDPGVYVPRWQSEELARRAAALLPDAHATVADLCTGAGAIAAHLHAAAPTATVIGTDIDERAVSCAQRNGVAAVCGDLGDALRSGSFDVVTAVAPYVPSADLDLLPSDVRRHEPRTAHDGGVDGLDLVRRVTVTAARLLRPGGWLLNELGGDQADALTPLLASLGFRGVTCWYDEEDDLRGMAAQLAG